MSLIKQFLAIALALAAVECAIDEMQYGPARVRAARQAVEPGSLPADAFLARIIGGTSIKPGSWPWLVWLGNCGGSLISPDWVLTASHCISGTITRQKVTMGTRNQNGQGGKVCGIKRAIKHPKFDSGPEMTSDAALIQMDCSVQFSAALSPVMLPKSTDNLRVDGVTVFIGGWGTTSEGGSVSPIALEAELKTVSPTKCAQTYGANDIDSTKLCAYGSGKDTCQGDSGGPLVTFDNARNGYVLYGLTSYGFGCGRSGVPGVYCHVPSVVDWVKQTAGISDNGGTTGGSVGGGGGTTVTSAPSTGGGSGSGCDVQSGQTYKLLNVGKDVLVSTTMVLRSVAGGLYELENSGNSAQVLTISNRVQQGNGERAVWSSRNGGANQRYSLISNSDSTCSVKASHSGRYLDMGSGTGACGPSVCAWDSDGSQTQKWRFYSQSRSTGGSVATPAASGSATASCGVSGTGQSTSYRLFNKGKNTNVEDTFWLKDTGNGAYEAVRTSDGKVLTEVSADQSTNGKQLSWVSDRSLSNQQFTLVSADDSYCHLQMVHSHKYLDMGSGSGACGSSVCQWQGDGSVTQLWRFTSV